jgi:hypothetical protein
MRSPCVKREPSNEVKNPPRLLLEFDLDAEPIGGVVTDQRGAEQAFHGWLQLTEAIEAARLMGQAELPRSEAQRVSDREDAGTGPSP